MNNSSDFMMYLHNERVQRMRQEQVVDQGLNRPINRGIESPFARVRSAISIWVSGEKKSDLNQS